MAEEPLEMQLQRIMEENEDYRLMLDAFHEDFLVADGQGVILRVSQSFEQSYHLTPAELIGQSVLELEQRHIFNPSVTRLVMESRTRQVLMQETKEGKQMLVTGVPVFNTHGQLHRIVSYSHDVTELHSLRGHLAQMEAEMTRVRSELERMRQRETEFDGLIISSDAMRQVSDTLIRVARHDVPVLLLGESGVGKSVYAKYLHRQSGRHEGPFIEVDCGAIPEPLMESELFGYESGAFTGASKKGKTGLVELAHNGTLFLDEVAELPLALQVKLLKVIQDRAFRRVGGTESITSNFRLVTATNRAIRDMVDSGQFREDLYYRINTVELLIPPLRERPQDIVGLTMHFLTTLNHRYHVDKRLAPFVVEALLRHQWPGNVRELEHVIERAIVLSTSSSIQVEDLAIPQIPSSAFLPNRSPALSLPTRVAEFEKAILEAARRQYHTTVEMSKHLGVSQPTIVRKLQKYFGQASSSESDESNS